MAKNSKTSHRHNDIPDKEMPDKLDLNSQLRLRNENFFTNKNALGIVEEIKVPNEDSDIKNTRRNRHMDFFKEKALSSMESRETLEEDKRTDESLDELDGYFRKPKQKRK